MAREKKRTWRIWVAVDPHDGRPIPFYGAWQRQQVRQELRRDERPDADTMPIRRATLTLDAPGRKR